MQLNRNSGIVRWCLFTNFCRSEEAKQKALAEMTNLCTFVQQLAFGTLLWVLLGVLFAVAVPCGWAITAFMLACGITVGWIPVGWNADVGINCLARVLLPALAFQWERKLGVRIGTRVIFPNYVWVTAVGALSVWAFARWEVAGWSRVEIPVAWHIAHGTALASIFVTVAIVLYAKWRNTEGWRVARAWLRAKKDRVCPRIEFVE